MKYKYSEMKNKISKLDNPNKEMHQDFLASVIDKSVSDPIPSWLEIKSIDDFAFSYCLNFTESITIPDGVTSIGDYAFGQCYNLTSITIPDSVTSIGDEAFYYTGYYNNEANWEHDGLVLYINNHLINTKEAALFGHYDVKDGTRTIGNSAFSQSRLTSITIPNSVITIGQGAFLNCIDLQSITIGNGITNIEDFVFQGCTSLNDIYLYSEVPPTILKVGYNPSTIPSTATVHVPVGSGDTYKTATNWSYYADQIVEDIEI